MERLLNINQAAEILTVKVATLRQWVFHKKISFVRVGGTIIRFKEKDLEAMLTEYNKETKEET